MQKSIEMEGANIDVAIENAMRFLSLERDDISVEVIHKEKKGFLGLGATPAKIRATYEVPDQPAAAPARKEPAPRAARKVELEPEVAAAMEKQLAEDREREQKERAERAERPRRERPARERGPRPERAERPRPAEAEAVEFPPSVKEENPSPAALRAREFVSGLLQRMGIEHTIDVLVSGEESTVCLEISGPDMGAVIGRRGDTLDAIQYLTSLVVSREQDAHIRVNLDTEHYRFKRRQALERLARKMAGKAVKYHKAMTLEPMNPYERRIIHSALQGYTGVTTYSTGTEPSRRVVIAPEGAPRRTGSRPPRSGRPQPPSSGQ